MLRRHYKVKQGMIWFRSGHIYSFKYKNYQNDPEPNIIVLYAVRGIHPNTGHKHNYIQAINFTYIPRHYRKEFVKIWVPLLEYYKGNILITWDMIQRRYPYLQIAIRRYLLDRQLITELREIPTEDIEKVVVSTWAKDYSKQVIMSMVSKYKKAKTMIRGTNPFSGRTAFSGKIFGGKK